MQHHNLGETNSGLRLGWVEDVGELEADWHKLEPAGAASIYQSYGWVKAALETLERGCRPVLVYGRKGKETQMILPLVLRPGPVQKLEWIGGNHANLRGGLFAPEVLKTIDAPEIRSIFSLLGRALGGVVVAHLQNQPAAINGQENPFLLLPNQPSVNPFFEMDLSGGFDAVLQAGNAKRKRKKFRSQTRNAEAAGGFDLVQSDHPDETLGMVREFLDLATDRLHQKGVKAVFSQPEVVDFYEAMASVPGQAPDRLLRMFALKIGGKTRAIFGGGVFNNRFHGFVNTISVDELSQISPGEMLLYMMVEQLASEEVQSLDLGAGDEPYKRSWCQHQITLFDTIHPVTAPAVPVALALKAYIHAKRYIRNDQTLWQMIRKFRQMKAKSGTARN